MNDEKKNWKTTALAAISVFENSNAPEDGKIWAKNQLIEVSEVAEDRDLWKDTVKLYINYKSKSDEAIKKNLEKIKLLVKCHKGEGTKYGYYYLNDEHFQKILASPRNVSLTFDATEPGEYVNEKFEELKTITFLVKSTSRFFLKPDIGEVFDQIDYRDMYDVKAIYVKLGNYEVIPGSQGEHFLMQAILFK